MQVHIHKKKKMGEDKAMKQLVFLKTGKIHELDEEIREE